MESDNLVFKEKVEKNQIKSKNKYEKLKSDYFLQKLFDNIERKRKLDIIKYNKKLKKRINKNNIHQLK